MAKSLTLDQLPIGKSARIKTVGGEGALRCRLLDMGLTPKTVVSVQKVAPMGDPIELRLRGYELTLRLEDAQKITVEAVEHLPLLTVQMVTVEKNHRRQVFKEVVALVLGSAQVVLIQEVLVAKGWRIFIIEVSLWQSAKILQVNIIKY